MSYLEELQRMWDSTANLISYHHADDSTKEWGSATALKPLLLELERQIKRYGGERPDASRHPLGSGYRIDWEKGQ